MQYFQADCPHCGTKAVAFKTEHSRQVKPNISRWDVLAVCNLCSYSILATFKGSAKEPMEIFPEPPKTDAPEYVPENVERFYTQGMQNMVGRWDAAGSMFRKALETALKAKFPDSEGSLYDRIEEAEKQHKLTPDLAKWAHEIRLDGNKAAHDEKPLSEEDAKHLQSFTHLVLTYLFTLPGMLEKARGKTAETAES